jgi:hypothetical protein
VPRETGDQVADVVRAALAVPGITAVRVEPDADDGLALLRLELAPGTDEQEIAQALDARLGRQEPSVPQPSPPAASPAEPPEPDVVSGTLPPPRSRPVAPDPAVAQAEPPAPPPEQPGRSSPAKRRSVPPVSAPTVASTPAPEWLASTEPGGSGQQQLGQGRLVLERVQQVTEGFATTSTVVLAQGPSRHTGVAEGAATASGAYRTLAAATARALESAASGRLRLDVEMADLMTFAGERTAVVVLSVMTRRGPERLSGASLAGGEPGRAVVKAVLAACNRRVSLEMGEH